MTGVADIVKQKAYNDFERWVFQLAAHKGIKTRHKLAELFYGRKDGKVVNVSTVYNIFSGKQKPTTKTLRIWASKLGTNLHTISEHLPDLIYKPTPLPATTTREIVLHPDPPKAKTAKTDDQFALVVDADGLANIRLNLVGVPMSKALRIMGALTGAGLLGATDE